MRACQYGALRRVVGVWQACALLENGACTVAAIDSVELVCLWERHPEKTIVRFELFWPSRGEFDDMSQR